MKINDLEYIIKILQVERNKSKGFPNFDFEKKSTQDFFLQDERITLLSKQIDAIAGNIDVKINRRIDKLNRRIDTIDDGGLDDLKNAFKSLQNRVADLDGMGGY